MENQRILFNLLIRPTLPNELNLWVSLTTLTTFQYTVFGKLIDGFDSLDSLEKVEVDAKHRPTSETKINSVTIHANPFADQQ